PTPTASTTATTTVPSSATASENSAMALINQNRSQSGLSALNIDGRLVRAAQLHAQDMNANGYFSHTGRNGSSVRTRVTAQGYSGCFWSENISTGRGSPTNAVEAWMNSDKHRANILSRSARQIGVGQSGPLWVAVFAAPC
ncbi:MAG: CAP domain-containing protein, partial [Pseudomonadota bacterium]